MIYESEILKGKSCPDEYKSNLLELLIRINKVRDAWSRPMIVTSGFRTIQEHKRIYKKKIAAGEYVPMSSKHLSCQAIDIADPKKLLQKWCKQNEKLLAEIGLWMEDFTYTPTWVHFQTVAPASGNRFFKIVT